MLIVSIKEQLGNQMFAYASVKSVALEKGIDFGWCYMNQGIRINDSDQKYGHDIFTVFHLPEEERVMEIPAGYREYTEPFEQEKDEKKYYNIMMKELADNTFANGHFISTVMIKNKLPMVREWFDFPDDIKRKVDKKLTELRRKRGEYLVAVHFRVNDEFAKGGFRLEKRYWSDAAKYIKKRKENPVFICIYDQKNDFVTDFIKKFSAEEVHGSLVEDMYLMTVCNADIVCNSSFSAMGALLNPAADMVVRPRKIPSGRGKQTVQHIYLDTWEIGSRGYRDYRSVMMRGRHLINVYRKRAMNKVKKIIGIKEGK